MQVTKDIIDEISNINKAIGAPDLTKPILALVNSTEKMIFVTVLGQFKSGKSSLLNSIIGENLLPVGVVPVTSTVTRLRFGDRPRLIIQYNNHKEIVTGIDELPQYVTEKHNPENINNVAQVTVEHPALEPFQSVNLVDTPGLGSFYKHNSDTTLQWLPFTGIALVSVSAERPLSEEDIGLLKGIAQYCQDVALVITKTDLFNANELLEIRSHISKSVKQAMKKDIPIFEYSIYKNLQKYRHDLMELLFLPLHLNYDAKYKEITRHKTHNIIEQSLAYTKLALQSALKREKDKDSVNKMLMEIRKNRHYHEQEMILSGSSFKGEIREKLRKIILPHLSSVSAKLARQFRQNYFGWNGSLYSISRKYEHWLEEHIEAEISQIDSDSFDEVNQIVKEIVDYYQYSALRFRHRMDEKLNQVFGVQLPETYWKIDFTGIDKPDISIYQAFDSQLDSLLFFLPMRWFRKMFFRHFYNQIPYETEKNIHRFISDLTAKIIKTIDDIHGQTLQFVDSEIKTVENILQQTHSDYEKIRGFLQRLRKIKSEGQLY